jgi:type I restriction enzyme S subunit
VPNGWVWSILPNLCTIPITDGTHQTPTYTDKEHGIPFISSKDVTSQKINWDNIKYITKELHEELYKRVAPQKDDILLAKNGTTGVAAIVEDSRVFDIYVTLALIRPNKNVNPYYLYYVINSGFCKEQFNSHLTGIGLPNLHLTDIKKTFIPLPPLTEQERIVSEIKRRFTLIDKLEQEKTDLLTAIKQTKSKILDLAIHGKLVPQDLNDEPASELLKRINPNAEITCDNGQYGKMPEGWCETILGELFEHNTGKALNSSNQEGVMRDYLTTSNVYWDTFDLSVVKQMLFKENELEKCTVVKGDLLVCEGGDVGRSAIWNLDYDVCIQNHLHRLRPKAELSVRFYYHVLKYLKDNNMIGGKGIGLLGLSSKELHKLPFPFPPYNEQQRIVTKIEELFISLDNIQKALEV